VTLLRQFPTRWIFIEIVRLLWTICAAVMLSAASAEERPLRPPAGACYPVDLGFLQDRLVVACRDGTLCVLDPARGTVLSRSTVGKQLSALSVLPDHQHVLVADSGRHCVLLVAYDRQQGWRVVRNWPTPHTPTRVTITHDGRTLVAACLWARQLWIGRVAGQQPLWADEDVDVTVQVLDLPFAPRALALDEQSGQLLVCDCFSNRLAVVDLAAGNVVRQLLLPGSNVRQVRRSPDGEHFYFVLQYASPWLPVERDHVFWGNIVNSVVVAISRKHLVEPPPTPADASDKLTGQTNVQSEPFVAVKRWSVWPLGRPGQGAADPESLLATQDGQWVIALGGLNAVALGSPTGQFQRITVGDRPTALVSDPAERYVFVANTLSHSVSVIDRKRAVVEKHIVLSEPTDITMVQAGERLFYDGRLSLDGWMSCHSCHTEGHSQMLNFDTLGDGDYGAPKRVLSLMGIAGTQPFAWNGSSPDLLTQMRRSLQTTMHAEMARLSDRDVAALKAYVESLPAPPGVAAARRRWDAAAAERGKQVFQSRGCSDCHRPPYYTSDGQYDVGMADERGRSRFNPPSLLGVSQRDAWLHDGRARSLRDVFLRFGHPDQTPWQAHELDDLLEWLGTL
jgi:YVTN family beta-propeller protein